MAERTHDVGDAAEVVVADVVHPRGVVVIPRWLEAAAAFGWRLIVVVAALIVMVVVITRLVVVVIPVLVAIMMSTVLMPPVRWLRRHGWPPLAATWAVFLGAFALVAVLVVLLEPSVAHEFQSLRHDANRGVRKIEHWLVHSPFRLSRDDIHQEFQRVGHYFSQHASGLAVRGATLAVELLVGVLFTLVLTFFILKDADKVTSGILRLAGEQRATQCRQLGTQCWATITGYVRGATINGLINGLLMALGIAVLGLPLAFPIGILTFVGGYFPIVGSIVSGGIAALVAVVARGPTAALVVVGITFAIHNLEGYVVGPLVLGRGAHLHPVSVLLSLAVGGVVGGVVGAFIAVPLTAVLTTVVNYGRSSGGNRIVVPGSVSNSV